MKLCFVENVAYQICKVANKKFVGAFDCTEHLRQFKIVLKLETCLLRRIIKHYHIEEIRLGERVPFILTLQCGGSPRKKKVPLRLTHSLGLSGPYGYTGYTTEPLSFEGSWRLIISSRR